MRKKLEQGWDVAQLVGCLSSMQETLDLTPALQTKGYNGTWLQLKLKVILSYIVNLRPAWVKWDSSQNNNKNNNDDDDNILYF